MRRVKESDEKYMEVECVIVRIKSTAFDYLCGGEQEIS